MIQPKHCLLVTAGLVMLITAVATLNALDPGSSSPNGAVQARFDLDHPDTGLFPSDVFTVADPTHNTGRRVNLPYPDCATQRSNCEDLDVINTLDGFGLQSRISIPFDGAIDPNTVTSETVFLISLGSTFGEKKDETARVVGINQIVWDAFTNTLHVESDELLSQYSRYAIIVTDGVRDAAGRPVEASEPFRRFRQTVRGEYKNTRSSRPFMPRGAWACPSAIS